MSPRGGRPPRRPVLPELPEPAIEPITPEQERAYSEARYRVTFVVPLVESPRLNVHEVDQGQMDALLDGYSEYAAYLVRVERVED